MHEPIPPRWPRAVLGSQVYEDVFEPAWHETRARRARESGNADRRGVGPGVGTMLLVLQCMGLRLWQVRTTRRGKDSLMATVLDDIRFAGRTLRRRPGFTVVAVLTLGLGIGANASIFSIVNGVLLRPLPFASPDELVTVDVYSAQGFGVSLSLPNHRDWRERNRSFEEMGAAASWSMVHRHQDGASVVEAQITIGGVFEVLGTPALIGRTYTADETTRGSAPVVVLTWGYWQREFAGDPSVLGSSIDLRGQPFTIIGVMPAEFTWPETEADLFAPMGSISTLPWDDRRSSFGARAIARLAPGTTLAAAEADIDRLTREIEAEEGTPGVTADLRTLREYYTGDVRTPYLLLMGAVAFVLLIAGVNVANLLLARGEERRREIAVRAALGAGRRAIVRQVLAESFVIATAGAAVGLAVAFASSGLIGQWLPLPRVIAPSVGVDATVVLFAAALAVVGGMTFGLVPALRLSSVMGASELRGGARGTPGRRRQRIRSTLVVVETTLALVLLVGSGLMLGSLSKLRQADVGYDAERVLTARVYAQQVQNPSREQWSGFYESVAAAVAAAPGVESAAISLLVPLAPRSWELLVLPEGEPYSAVEGESVLYNIVSPSWFETMGVSLLRGRPFDTRDRNDTEPVTVIDESMAELYWPGQDPIGRRITFERTVSEAGDTTPVYRTVVGVVPNVRHYDMREPSRVQAYVPLAQTLNTWGTSLNVVVRTTGPSTSFASRLRSIVSGLDPNVPVYDVNSLDGYMADDMAGDTALGGLLTVFGALALGLAAIGVFGVMSLVVAQRSKEIGVRLAIGARPPQVLAMVLGRTLALAGAGVVLGLLSASALSRLLGSFLYGLSPVSPGIYAGASAFLLMVAAAAALVPAARAARIDPMRTLRDEA